MPQYSLALDALRRPSRLRTSTGEEGMLYSDPSLELDSFQRGMSAELRDRIFNEMRSGAPDSTNNVQALQFLRDDYDRDIASSPLTKQGAEVDFWRDKNAKAIAEGFGGVNPAQEQAYYGRRIDEEKMRQPLQVQSMADTATMARQKLLGQQGLETLDKQHENTMEMYGKFPPPTMLAPGSRYAFNPKTGAYSAGQTYAPGGAGGQGPTGTVLNQLTSARNALEQQRAREQGGFGNRLGSFFGMEPSTSPETQARENAYQQAMFSVLQQMDPGAFEVQEMYEQATKRNPNLDLNKFIDYYAQIGQPFNPEEIELLRGLQYMKRIGQ